jgi:hypothetical protein
VGTCAGEGVVPCAAFGGETGSQGLPRVEGGWCATGRKEVRRDAEFGSLTAQNDMPRERSARRGQSSGISTVRGLQRAEER